MNTGKLYLIPTFLSDENANVLSDEVVKVARQLSEFIVENEKSARSFLKKCGTPVPMNQLKFYLLNEHTDAKEYPLFLQPLKEGRNLGLLSDAGCPAVADPGTGVIRLAHENKIKVVPLTGPSSILLGLMGSGLNGQRFRFHGYLPRESNQRKAKIRELEKDALRYGETQIFIETPYRNSAMLGDMLEVCQQDTRVCIGCNLTAPDEWIKTRNVSAWKKSLPDIQKKPCVFLIGK